MSTGKNKVVKLAELVDIEQVFSRIMGALGYTTIQEFADLVGCTAQAAYNYKRGDRDIPWSVIFAAMAKSGKSLDWLIMGRQDDQKVVKMPVGKNARDIVDWVESKGELAKDFDGSVRIAVAEKWPEFIEWQKKREQRWECGVSIEGKSSI